MLFNTGFNGNGNEVTLRSRARMASVLVFPGRSDIPVTSPADMFLMKNTH